MCTYILYLCTYLSFESIALINSHVTCVAFGLYKSNESYSKITFQCAARSHAPAYAYAWGLPVNYKMSLACERETPDYVYILTCNEMVNSVYIHISGGPRYIYNYLHLLTVLSPLFLFVPK